MQSNLEEIDIEYADYTDESMLPDIQRLVAKDLSEPYSIFTYRYFLHTWPKLCICTYVKNKNTNDRKMIATLVCKIEEGSEENLTGYIAMLAVDQNYRKRGIGLTLSSMGIERMVEMGCKEIMLETEATNTGALGLYSRLGFMREDKMSRYYLNGGDAYRLKLFIDCNQDS